MMVSIFKAFSLISLSMCKYAGAKTISRRVTEFVNKQGCGIKTPFGGKTMHDTGPRLCDAEINGCLFVSYLLTQGKNGSLP